MEVLIKGKNLYAAVVDIYSKNKSFIYEIIKKEKEIYSSVAVAPQTVGSYGHSSVHCKCLVKMERC